MSTHVHGETPCGPLITSGMWVFDNVEEFGRVTKVYVIDKDDYMNVAIYDRSGNKLRTERALEQSQWVRIETPVFPLPRHTYIDEVLKVID